MFSFCIYRTKQKKIKTEESDLTSRYILLNYYKHNNVWGKIIKYNISNHIQTVNYKFINQPR